MLYTSSFIGNIIDIALGNITLSLPFMYIGMLLKFTTSSLGSYFNITFFLLRDIFALYSNFKPEKY